MILDEGDIRGGFDHAYKARIVAPRADSSLLRSIEAATGIGPTATVQVEVITEGGTTWTRGFAARFKPSSGPCVFTTPNPYVLGVRVQGVCYVVNATHPSECWELPVLPLECVATDVVGRRLFLADDTKVIGFDGLRVLWESRRVSLDGIRDLSYAAGTVRGTATDVGIDAVPFTINALTGDAEGGFEGFRLV